MMVHTIEPTGFGVLVGEGFGDGREDGFVLLGFGAGAGRPLYPLRPLVPLAPLVPGTGEVMMTTLGGGLGAVLTGLGDLG